eukprot:scaffold24907_cov137-Isochrysis_galbana.AAC.1
MRRRVVQLVDLHLHARKHSKAPGIAPVDAAEFLPDRLRTELHAFGHVIVGQQEVRFSSLAVAHRFPASPHPGASAQLRVVGAPPRRLILALACPPAPGTWEAIGIGSCGSTPYPCWWPQHRPRRSLPAPYSSWPRPQALHLWLGRAC